VIVTNGAVIIESAGEITTISVLLSSELMSSSLEQEENAALTAMAAYRYMCKCFFVIIFVFVNNFKLTRYLVAKLQKVFQKALLKIEN
jgi:hypothetical protein